MKRVLVPVDGSANSIKALEYVAKRAAKGEKLETLIVNVQADFPVSDYMNRADIKEWQQSEFKKTVSSNKLGALARQLKSAPKLLLGDPGKVIPKYAKQQRCDEIVMATRGMGSFKGMVLGSVANKVVHLSPVPVILIR